VQLSQVGDGKKWKEMLHVSMNSAYGRLWRAMITSFVNRIEA